MQSVIPGEPICFHFARNRNLSTTTRKLNITKVPAIRLIIYLFSIGSRVDTRRITWNRTGPERNPFSSLSVFLIFIRNRYCVSYCHSGAFIELNTLIWRHALATRSFCLGLWRLTKNNCVLTGILFFVEW